MEEEEEITNRGKPSPEDTPRHTLQRNLCVRAVMCNCFAFEKVWLTVTVPRVRACPPRGSPCASTLPPFPLQKGKFACSKEGKFLPLLLPSSLIAPVGTSRCLGSRPGRAPAAARFHVSFGWWWGKPNPSVGGSLDLTYRVGYIRSEAVRSIPRSFSLYSLFHIYPTGSSPHTKTHLDLGTAEQRVNPSPTEQPSWKRPSWK